MDRVVPERPFSTSSGRGPAECSSGVPQGTVLGPILFLIFINNITFCVTNSVIRCFADDTRIMKAISQTQDMPLLQQDLDRVTQWSIRNNMSLHEDKFEFLSHAVNRSNTNPLHHLPFTCEVYQYSTSKGNFTPVQQLRDLGVTVSSYLSWTLQISTMATKARQKAAWVLSVFHTRSSTIMLTLYKSNVHGTQFTRILLPIMESV